MPSCYPRSPRVRIFCMYFFSTTLLTTIIYAVINSHLQLVGEMKSLETDMKYIMKEVGLITQEVFHQNSDRKDPPCFQSGSDLSHDQLEMMVRRHTNILRMEWMQTKTMVESMMNKLDKKSFSANEVQLPRTDYALESLGAEVVDVEDTPHIKTNFILTLLGLTPIQNEPRNLIRPSMLPGDCYAFKGSSSNVTIKLGAKILIDSVSIHHITDRVSPTQSISSAPRNFSVYGLKTQTDPRPFFFGSYGYDSSLGRPVQEFVFIQIATEGHRYVQFGFRTNSGHANFTCIYRISVHGRLDQADGNEKTEGP